MEHDVFATIIQDLTRKAEWYEQAPDKRALLRMCFSDGSTAQLLYRAMRFCQIHRLKPLAFLLYRLNAVLGHVVIGRGAEIGPGLVIVHSFGIVINTQVKAGKNLVLEHGVTIGAEKRLSPTLGDNVFVGAGDGPSLVLATGFRPETEECGSARMSRSARTPWSPRTSPMARPPSVFRRASSRSMVRG